VAVEQLGCQDFQLLFYPVISSFCGVDYPTVYFRADQPVRDQEPHFLLCYHKKPHHIPASACARTWVAWMWSLVCDLAQTTKPAFTQHGN